MTYAQNAPLAIGSVLLLFAKLILRDACKLKYRNRNVLIYLLTIKKELSNKKRSANYIEIKFSRGEN